MGHPTSMSVNISFISMISTQIHLCQTAPLSPLSRRSLSGVDIAAIENPFISPTHLHPGYYSLHNLILAQHSFNMLQWSFPLRLSDSLWSAQDEGDTSNYVVIHQICTYSSGVYDGAKYTKVGLSPFSGQHTAEVSLWRPLVSHYRVTAKV